MRVTEVRFEGTVCLKRLRAGSSAPGFAQGNRPNRKITPGTCAALTSLKIPFLSFLCSSSHLLPVEACLELEMVGEVGVSSVVWEESQVRMQPIRILSVPPVEDLDLQLPRVSEENKNTKCAVIPICFAIPSVFLLFFVFY